MATYTVTAPDGHDYIVEGPEGASDEDIIAAITASLPPGYFDQVKSPTPAPTQPTPAAPGAHLPDRTHRQELMDTGLATQQGVVHAGQAALGIADTATQGRVGNFIEEHVGSMANLQKAIAQKYSPQQQEMNRVWDNAQGIEEHVQAVKDYPSLLLTGSLQSAPSMILGSKIGRRLEKAGVGRATALGTGEAAVSTGSLQESARERHPGEVIPANITAVNMGTGAITGAIGGAGSAVTKAIGGIDPNAFLMGGGRKLLADKIGDVAASDPGVIRSVLASVLGESIQEYPQEALEHMASNYAQGIPLKEGTNNAGIKGMILGATMAGGAAVTHQGMNPTTPDDPTLTPEGAEALKRAEFNKTQRDARTAQESGEITRPDAMGTAGVADPTIIPADTVASWGIAPGTKLYKDLSGVDLQSEEGKVQASSIIEAAASHEALPPKFNYSAYASTLSEVPGTKPASDVRNANPSESGDSSINSDVAPRPVNDNTDNGVSTRAEPTITASDINASEPVNQYVPDGATDSNTPNETTTEVPLPEVQPAQVVALQAPRYVTGEAETTGHTANSLEAALSPEMKQQIADGTAVMHNTQETLPAPAEGATHPDNVRGMVDSQGVVHHVANQLTPETVHTNAIPELVAHTGLETIVTPQGWDSILHTVESSQAPVIRAARLGASSSAPEAVVSQLLQAHPTAPLSQKIMATAQHWVSQRAGAKAVPPTNTLRDALVSSLQAKIAPTNADIQYSEIPEGVSPEAAQVIHQRNTRMAEQETKLSSEPKVLSTGFRRVLDTIANGMVSSDAAFSRYAGKQLQEYGIPHEMTVKLKLAVSQSQAVHDTSVAGAAVKLGRLVLPTETNPYFTAEYSEDNLEHVQDSLTRIGAQYGLDKVAMDGLFTEIMVARRITGIVSSAQKALDTASALPEKTQKAFMGQAHIQTLLRAAETENQHMPLADRQTALKLLDSMPELSAHEGPIQMWDRINLATVNSLVSMGFYSRDHAENLVANAGYAPMYRDMTPEAQDALMEEMAKGQFTGSRGLLSHRKDHKLKGSTREVLSMMQNMEQWQAMALSKGIKNYKSIQTVNFAQDFMPPGFITEGESEKSKPGSMYLMRNGVKSYFSVDDPLFMDAFRGLPPVNSKLLKSTSSVGRFVRHIIVRNPLFTIGQLFLQDTYAGFFTSGLHNPLALMPEVFSEFAKTLSGKSSTHAKLYKVGAVGQLDYSDMAVRRNLEMSMGLSAGPSGIFSKIGAALDKFSMHGDNAFRQAVYNRTIAELGDTPQAEALATERAFEIINFRRRGTSTTVDALRQVVPFFGAYLQVQSVAYRTLTGTSISPTQRSKALKTLANTTAQVMALSFMYNALIAAGDDDDSYNNMNPYMRDTHLYVLGADKPFTLPLRRDIFLLPHMIMTHGFDAMDTTGTGVEHPKEAAKHITGLLTPTSILGTAMPMFIKPLVEIYTNKNFTTGDTLIDPSVAGRETAEQFNSSTSETAKMLGKTGVMAPINIDHLIKGYTATTGSLLLMFTDSCLRAGMKAVNKPLPEMEMSTMDKVRAVPGLSAFAPSDKGSRTETEFYEVQNQLDSAVKSLAVYKTDSEQYKKYAQTHPYADDKQVKSEVAKIGKTLAEIRLAERYIKGRPDSEVSPADKLARYKELQDKHKEATKEVRKLQDVIYKVYPPVQRGIAPVQ